MKKLDLEGWRESVQGTIGDSTLDSVTHMNFVTPPRVLIDSPSSRPHVSSSNDRFFQSSSDLEAESALAANDAVDSETLIEWITDVISQHGGRVNGANLGSALSASNSKFYGVIKAQYGGLTPLLSKFPDRFTLSKDPPFNHVAINSNPQNPPHSPPRLGLTSTASSPNNSQAASNAAPFTASIAAVEDQVVTCTAQILSTAPSKTLKAVELANLLRAQCGTEVLARAREFHGGLLSLLENHQPLFKVTRVPKSDSVSLTSELPIEITTKGSMPAAGTSVVAVGEDNSSLGLVDMGARHPHRQHSGGAGSSGGLALVGAGAGVGGAGGRCLHVGNVAAGMKESELCRQFSQFGGQIESLKLVSQKGRRFAFINFHTAAQAEATKAALSKLPQWKSNLSFAKRDTISTQRKRVGAIKPPPRKPRSKQPTIGGQLSSGINGKQEQNSRKQNVNYSLFNYSSIVASPSHQQQDQPQHQIQTQQHPALPPASW